MYLIDHQIDGLEGWTVAISRSGEIHTASIKIDSDENDRNNVDITSYPEAAA